MILLLGASGYVGQAFAAELRRRRCSFIPLTRRAIDYSSFDVLFDYVRKMRPEFLINAAGYAPNPNVDACESAREEVLCANTLLPQTIARACLMTNTPWGHVSSGSIYTGAKVAEWGRLRVVRNLNRPEMRRLLTAQPEKFRGFTEWDEPNFSFRHVPCNFYSGTKALAEEAIRGVGQCYIWRPRMLFNECDEPRNLLAKLQHYDRVYDSVNSITHLDEFVRACLELWERQAPFGIYNVVNPGAVATRRIVEMIRQFLDPRRAFEFWEDDEAFYQNHARTPRSNCILDPGKLLALGVKMRPVEKALEDALERWHTAKPIPKFAMAAVH
ncbi:MAG TPA: sugar nucleotide-binding protein [Verrucomicrobiae bacterium]|nr:sugar nucleotide-binding protein [Verrucomicrobiae bacterium]